MHQNSPLLEPKAKKILGGGTASA